MADAEDAGELCDRCRLPLPERLAYLDGLAAGLELAAVRLLGHRLSLEDLADLPFEDVLRVAVTLPDPDQGDALADLRAELVTRATCEEAGARAAAAAGLLAADSAIARARACCAAALAEHKEIAR